MRTMSPCNKKPVRSHFKNLLKQSISIHNFSSCFRLKCEYLGIDIQDDMGRHEVGFVENTVKTPIGTDEEGCLFEARFHINKVRKVYTQCTYCTVQT